MLHRIKKQKPDLVAKLAARVSELEREIALVPEVARAREVAARDARQATRFAVLALPTRKAIRELAAMPSADRRIVLGGGGLRLYLEAPERLAEKWFEDLPAAERDLALIKRRELPERVKVAMTNPSTKLDWQETQISEHEFNALKRLGLDRGANAVIKRDWDLFILLPPDLDNRYQVLERKQLDALTRVDHLLRTNIEKGTITVTPLTREENEAHTLSRVEANVLSRAEVRQLPLRRGLR